MNTDGGENSYTIPELTIANTHFQFDQEIDV